MGYERHTINEIVEDYIDLDSVTLKTLRGKIDEWIKKYGSDAYFNEEEDIYDDRSRHLAIRKPREETDRELKDRIKRDRMRRKENEERELIMYQELRKKYDKSLTKR